MAKIAKSKDTKNWRKGKDLQVGDLVAVHWDERGVVTETSPVVEYLGKEPYMGVTNHVFMLANGRRKFLAGGEFVRGCF